MRHYLFKHHIDSDPFYKYSCIIRRLTGQKYTTTYYNCHYYIVTIVITIIVTIVITRYIDDQIIVLISNSYKLTYKKKIKTFVSIRLTR